MELLGKKCIGSLGRLVIPSEIRARWALKPNTMIEIHLNGDLLILRKAGEQCALCGETITGDNYVKFSRFFDQRTIILCDSCHKFLRRKFEEDGAEEKVKTHIKGGI